MKQHNNDKNTENFNISGRLSKKCTYPLIQVLLTVTGLSLALGIFELMGRYLLALRKNATATLANGTLTIKVTYSIFGKPIKNTQTITAAKNINAIEMENKARYLHLLVGFGFLVIGLFCGVHWLLDGLGARYPYLALIGAGVILAGVAADLLLYYFIPEGPGKTHVGLAIPGWRFRLLGVSNDDATSFITRVTSLLFTDPNQHPDEPATS